MNPSKVTVYDENGNVLYTGRIANISIEYRSLECDCRFVVDRPAEQTTIYGTPVLKTVEPSYRAIPFAKAKPEEDTAAKPTTVPRWTILGPGFPTVQPHRTAPTPPKAGCTCDIKDLMSTGHNPGCPEKK